MNEMNNINEMNKMKSDGRPRGSRWGRGGQPKSDTGRAMNEINESDTVNTVKHTGSQMLINTVVYQGFWVLVT